MLGWLTDRIPAPIVWGAAFAVFPAWVLSAVLYGNWPLFVIVLLGLIAAGVNALLWGGVGGLVALARQRMWLTALLVVAALVWLVVVWRIYFTISP